MDFGSGTVETRSFPLETGLSFNVAAKKVAFDWRGRIPEAWVFPVYSSSLDKSLPVDVSGSGDITVGGQHFPDQLIPAVAIADVTGDTLVIQQLHHQVHQRRHRIQLQAPPQTPLQRRHLTAAAETMGMAAQAMEMVTETIPRPRPLQSRLQRQVQRPLQV